MSQSDYIHQKRNNVVFQTQNQKKMQPVLNSVDYTDYKTYSSTMLPNTDTFPKYSNELPLENIQYIFDTKQNVNQCILDCSNIKLVNKIPRQYAQTPMPTKRYMKNVPLHRILDGRYIDSMITPEQKKNKPNNGFFSTQLYSTKRYLDTIHCACKENDS